MSRARGEKEYLGVLKGLNTEANALAFPEGYSSDEQNFLLAKDGTIRVRRKGLENTSDDQSYTSGSGNPVLIRSYYWEKPNVVLAVVSTLQHEVMLRIHRNDSDFTYIDEYQISSNAGSGFDASFSPVLNGVAIVGGGIFGRESTPIILEYVETDSEINIYSIDLYFRDFELIPDDLNIDERPYNLSDEHKYNIFNAGWGAKRQTSDGLYQVLSEFEDQVTNYTRSGSFDSTYNSLSMAIGSVSIGIGDTFIVNSATNTGTYTVANVVGVSQFAIIYFSENIATSTSSATVDFTIKEGGYPSNADIPALGVKADSSGKEIFSADTLYETSVGNTEAPRGHFIYSVFGSRDREDAVVDPKFSNTPTSTIELKDTIAI